MGRVLFIAALFVLLAACSIKTPEGAACDAIGEVSQCPEGQRCGADGVCSFAANECGEICTASSCDGVTNVLSRCDQVGVCASLATVQCNPHQNCNPSARQCICKQSAECPTAGKRCLDGNTLRTCGDDEGCPFFDRDDDCALGEDCVDGPPQAACKCPDVGDAEGQGCVQHDVEKCVGAFDMYTCAPRVPGSNCWTWKFHKACTNGLVCQAGLDGACVCPDHKESPVVRLVDPAAAPFDGARPNGTDPLACRYQTLRAALLDAQSGETVKAKATTYPATFPGEAATVPSGVSLVADEATQNDPSQVIFLLEGTDTTGLTIRAGGSASGLTVRKAASSAATVGIEVTGASRIGVPSLKDVVVDAQGAGGAFATGVLVSGAGTVRLDAVSASGSTSAGVSVEMLDGLQLVEAGGLVVDGNAAGGGPGVGVLLRNGELSLSAPTVKRSANHGLIADPVSGGEVRLSVSGGQVHANRGTGLFIRGAKKLSMVGVRVCENQGSPQAVGASQRSVGGVYLAGAAPQPVDQTFQGLRIHKNAGDQVAVGAGAATWVLDGLADPFCGVGRNEFAEYTSGLGIAAGAPVLARNNGWKNDPPTAQDAAAFGALGAVATGAEPGSSAYCPVATDLACPAP